MLKVGAYFNLLLAVAHILTLPWLNKAFELTGVSGFMQKISIIHPVIPYVLVICIALAFLVFGLYGLSAEGKIRRLPFLELGIFIISGIYLFRGIMGLIGSVFIQTGFTINMVYSLIALGMGLLYLLGGLKKWN